MPFSSRKDRKWFFLALSFLLHLVFLLLLIVIEPLTSSKYIPGPSFEKRAMKVSFLGKYSPVSSKPKKLSAPSKPKLSKSVKKEEAKVPEKKITAKKELKQKVLKKEKKKLVKAKTSMKKKKKTKKLAKIKRKKTKIKSKKKQPRILKRKLKKVEIAYKKLLEQKKKEKLIKLKQLKKVTLKERRKITSSKDLRQKVQQKDQRRLAKALIKAEKKKIVKKIDRMKKKIVKKKPVDPLKKTKIIAQKKVQKSPIQVKRRAEKLLKKKATDFKSTIQKAEMKKKDKVIPEIKMKQLVKVPEAKKSDSAKPRPYKPRKTEEKSEMAVVMKSTLPLFIENKDSEKILAAPAVQEVVKQLEVPRIKQETGNFDAHAPPKLADQIKELYDTIMPQFPLGPEEKYTLTATEPTLPQADKISEKSAETVKKNIGEKRKLTLAETEKLTIKLKTEEKEKDYQTAKSLEEHKLELAEGEIETTRIESQGTQPELGATSSKIEVETFNAGASFKELIEKVQLEQNDQYYEQLIDKSILDWLEEDAEENLEEKNFALEEETSVVQKPKFTPTATEKVEIASLRKAQKPNKKISIESFTAGNKKDKAGSLKGKSGTGEGAYITVNLPFSNITQTPWFKLTGQVVNLSTDKLYMTINGVSQVIPVVHGAFATRLDLSQGVNKISLLALSNINSLTAKKDVLILYSVAINLPTIHLSLPIDGTQGLKEGDTIIVEGTVDDPFIKRAVLFFNKRPIRITVRKGRFHKKVYMSAGRIGTIRVMALTKKRIKIYSSMHTVLSGYDTNDMMNPRPY